MAERGGPGAAGTACPHDDTLVAFADLELDDGDRRVAVGTHLETCSVCRGLVARLVRSAAGPGVTAVDPMRLRSGDRLGRYVVESLLGFGGMGIVYAARDPELDRSVAIKLLRPELVTSDARARLAREARVMARLSHANVVSVHDVGSDGAADFIVMERVVGINLRRWCAEPRSVREILDVFVAAGAGLSAAHRAGIVHGDFKPDNVLVGPEGRVLVGDFGLAQAAGHFAGAPLVAEAAAFEHAAAGRSGRFGGTPAYMAPEQLRGGPASASSDQFSFAASLYECLCGVKPFGGRCVDERLALMGGMHLAAPSTKTSLPRWLSRVLRRALAEDPGARFPSVDALVAELKRPPSRRRRIGVAAAILLSGGVALAATAARAPVCPTRSDAFHGIWDAAMEAQVATAFAAADAPYAEESLRTAARALDAYVAQWQVAHREVCEATRVRHEQSEELMAARLACLEERRSDVAAVTSRLVTADPKAVENVVEAVAGLPRVERCNDVERVRAAYAATGKARSARFGELVARGEAACRLGHLDEAVALAGEARALGEGVAAAAEVELLLGEVARERGDFKAAVTHFDEALVSASAVADPRVMARVWLGLADAQVRRHKVEDAERSLRQAEAFLERFEDHGLVAERFRIRGNVLNARARHEDATTLLEEGYRHVEAKLGATSLEAARLSTELARALGNQPERDTDARRWYERSVELAAALKGAGHPAVALAHNNYGNYLRRTGRIDEAVSHLDAALRIRERTIGVTHPHYVSTVINLAIVRNEQGRYDDGAALCEQAVLLLSSAPEPDDYRMAAALLTLGEAKLGAGEPAAAAKVLARAVEHRKRAVGSPHPHVGYDLWAKGRAELALERYELARESLEQADGELGDAGLAGVERARFRIDQARASWGAARERGPR